MHSDPGHTGHVGGYQDVYVKTPQGWRFKSRVHVVKPFVPERTRFPPVGACTAVDAGSAGPMTPRTSTLAAAAAVCAIFSRRRPDKARSGDRRRYPRGSVYDHGLRRSPTTRRTVCVGARLRGRQRFRPGRPLHRRRRVGQSGRQRPRTAGGVGTRRPARADVRQSLCDEPRDRAVAAGCRRQAVRHRDRHRRQRSAVAGAAAEHEWIRAHAGSAARP